MNADWMLYAATALVAIVVFLTIVPRILIWLGNWLLNRLWGQLNAFTEQREQRHAEIRRAMDELERYRQERTL